MAESGTDAKTKLIVELVLSAATAALGMVFIFAGLRHLDPNREASKRALESRKQLSKRLGRPLIHTTPYEVNSENTKWSIYLNFFFISIHAPFSLYFGFCFRN